MGLWYIRKVVMMDRLRHAFPWYQKMHKKRKKKERKTHNEWELISGPMEGDCLVFLQGWGVKGLVVITGVYYLRGVVIKVHGCL